MPTKQSSLLDRHAASRLAMTIIIFPVITALVAAIHVFVNPRDLG